MFPGQRVNEVKLGAIGVLVLVNHNITVARPTGGQRVRMFRKQSQRQQDQIVEVDLHCMPAALIRNAQTNMLGQGAHARGL